MYLPLIGRFKFLEWPILILSLVFVFAESIIMAITSMLPSPIIKIFDAITAELFSMLPGTGFRKLLTDEPLNDLVNQINQAEGFVEICAIFGYEAEEHIVKTEDGYLLGIHRIGGGKNSRWRNPISKNSHKTKPIVYLHHGLLMNSEVWVVNTDPSRNLPFVLAELGYDVWLGNNRGNKYSKKHLTLRPSSSKFWDFCIDEFALYDIPDTINYILQTTEQKDLAYIGFSQGSAQAFAALSINPLLNKKVRLFIALAPAMAPPGLNNPVVDTLARLTPSVMYLFFGHKAIMKSATFWQSLMFPPLFVRTIDHSLLFLFNWKGLNIDYPQKLASYAHLYSYTSVKSVVHWFQIIRSGRFHMYDDDFHTGLLFDKGFYKVAPFPTHNILTPILLVYGKVDSLVSIDVMLKELPSSTVSIGIEHHEHLDLLWGRNVNKLVFPHILQALESQPNPSGSLELSYIGQQLTVVKKSPLVIQGFEPSHTRGNSASSLSSSLRTSLELSPSEELLKRNISGSLTNSGFNIGAAEPVVKVTKPKKHMGA